MANQQNHERFQCCFQNWLNQQHLDLDEMQQALEAHRPDSVENLRFLADKIIKHYEEYMDNRAALAKHDATSFFSPSWCTTFENSFLWIGGCRPSLSIRLIYSLCGSELEAQLSEFLKGVRKGNLGELSAPQLKSIDVLQAKTVKEEDKLSSWLASLQEGIADEPLAMLANGCTEVGESRQGVDQVLDAHALALSNVLMAADKLRMTTIKEVIEILTPLQAVELLVASKKLNLSLHEWSKTRDQKMGILHSQNIPPPTYGQGSGSQP